MKIDGFLLLSIITLTIGSIFFGINLRTPAGWEYEGQEVFYTESDYAKFKESILNDDVVEWEVDTLSSSPPIITQFTILTEQNYRLPYGNERVVSRTNSAFCRDYPIAMAGFVMMIIGALGLLFGPLFYEENT